MSNLQQAFQPHIVQLPTWKINNAVTLTK